MKRRNQPKRVPDSVIEETVRKNEGIGICKFAELLGVDSSRLETRLHDVVNVYYHK